MKLVNVQIQNFRCIDDTTPFSIKQTTCLVGKNESGKTAILQALERLNPYDETRKKYNKLQDYPRRHYSDYASRHPDNEATVLTTKWQLEPDDVQVLEEEFGRNCLKIEEIKIFKHYEDESQSWYISIDIRKALQHLMGEVGLTAAEKQSFAKFDSSEKLYTHLHKLGKRNATKTALMERISKYRAHSIHTHAIDLISKRLPKFLYFSQYSRMNGDVSIQ